MPGRSVIRYNSNISVSVLKKRKSKLPLCRQFFAAGACPIKKISLIILMLFILFLFSSAFCSELTDKKGRSITIHSPFNRIISLYGAHTENLYAIGAGNNIIGVSVNDKYPEQVFEKNKFSYHDGPEKFMAAMPDLVLIRPMIDNGYPQLINQLEKSGITVVSLQPSSIEEMYIYWHTLGMLTGKGQNAHEMIQKFKRRIKNIKEKTHDIEDKKKVYFEAIHRRMKTFTRHSMPIFALETAGGINIAEDAQSSRNTNIAVYGKEQILAKGGQIDIFLAQKGVMNAVTIDMIKNEAGFQVIKAIRDNQVYLIDENIVSRPVPRLYEGILSIGTILYPDIFEEIRSKEDE